MKYQSVSVAAARLGMKARTLRLRCEKGLVRGVLSVECDKQTMYAVPVSVTMADIVTPTRGRPKEKTNG